MNKLKVAREIYERVPNRLGCQELLAGMQSVMTSEEFNKVVTKACLKLNYPIFGKEVTNQILTEKYK